MPNDLAPDRYDFPLPLTATAFCKDLSMPTSLSTDRFGQPSAMPQVLQQYLAHQVARLNHLGRGQAVIHGLPLSLGANDAFGAENHEMLRNVRFANP